MQNYTMIGLFIAYNARLPKDEKELADFYKNLLKV